MYGSVRVFWFFFIFFFSEKILEFENLYKYFSLQIIIYFSIFSQRKNQNKILQYEINGTRAKPKWKHQKKLGPMGMQRMFCDGWQTTVEKKNQIKSFKADFHMVEKCWDGIKKVLRISNEWREKNWYAFVCSNFFFAIKLALTFQQKLYVSIIFIPGKTTFRNGLLNK